MRSPEEIRQLHDDAMFLTQAALKAGEEITGDVETFALIAGWCLGDENPEIVALIEETHAAAERLRETVGEIERRREN